MKKAGAENFHAAVGSEFTRREFLMQGIGVGAVSAAGLGAMYTVTMCSHVSQKGVFAMLVLSRKPGEQIVLPELDITVTVLGISGKRVRVGIAAPPEISIQRHEIRDRVCERMVPPPNTIQTAAGAMASVPLSPDLDATLAHSITRRTAGQIGSLHVEIAEGRVIIHGRSRSSHTRQLAQEAVMEALKSSSSCHPVDLEYRIEMVTDRAPRKLTG